MMKKIIAVILSVLFIVALFPMQTFAASYSGTCGKNLTWWLDTDTGVLTISGSGSMPDFTSVRAPWDSQSDNIKSVDIKNNVTSISDYAFRVCRSLTSVTIPDSVTSIGDCAFIHCSSLTSITIPRSVTSIGDSAFYGCSSLTSIDVYPNNPAYFSIDGVLFKKDKAELLCCPGGKSGEYSIPYNVTSIEGGAFSGCSSLTDITIPDSVTSIGSSAFYGCSSLTDITIPDSVTRIGNYAFDGCNSLTSINIPDGVTSIGIRTFGNCSSLTSITIPDGVTSIGSNAFTGCSSLASVTIPRSVTSIDSRAFYEINNFIIYCSKNSVAHKYAVQNGNKYILVSGDGWSFDFDTGLLTITETGSYTETSDAPWYELREQIKTISFCDEITYIGSYAFYGCTSLTSITIPESVTSIGYCAFGGCSSLTSITIPFVGEIKCGTSNMHFGYIFGASSYSDNPDYVPASLKTVTITGGTRIGDYAFYDCDNLTSITISESITSIGNMAFSGTAFYSNEANWENGVLYCGNYLIEAKETLSGSYKITEGTKVIADHAFHGCGNLTSITIPYSVTSIGDDAFCGCTSLTNITIPNSVTSIGSSAFGYCSSLASISIPFVGATKSGTSNTHFGYIFGASSYDENLSYVPQSLNTVKIIGGIYIGSYAFYGCSSLKSITIPESVTSLDEAAFAGCSNLVTVNILGNCKFGHDIFSDCVSLKNINIPTGIDSLGGAEIFKNCYSLENLFIPEKIKGISDSAFIGCDKLTLTVINNSYALEYAIANNIPYKLFAGDGINYSFNAEEETLIISGTGVMSDFGKENATPWYDYRDSIKKVIISDGVTNIGDNAFSNLTSLSSVKIADTVSEIGGFAFYNCSNLTEVRFGINITRIATDAFGNCSNILRVYSPSIDKWCEIEFEDANSNPLSCGAMLYIDNKLIRDISISNDVTSINDYAFFGCPTIRSIIIPEGVVTIGEDAFRNCVGLESVSLPSTLENIGLNAFSCENIKKVYITDLAKWCNINFNNYASNPLHIANVLYLNNEQIIDLNIPEGVEIIKSYAFYNFQGCSCLYIPATVTTVQEDAFYFCNFKSIVLQNGLDYYDKLYTTQFSGAHIVIPESVVFIPGNTISSSNVIFGKRGSEAENYALDNGNKFYKTPKSISIYSLPTKTVYYQESNKSDDRYFKSDGLKLLVEYYDGTTEVIDKDFITVGFNIEECGIQTISVLFGGQITTFEITILSKKITSIAVTTNPTKTKYIIGEDFSMLGMVVTMYFYDGTAEHIKLNSEMITGFDSSKVGIQSLTVSYYGNTATFDVEIIGYISQVNIIIPEPIVGETIPTLFVPKVEILPNNEYDFNLRGYWLSSSDGANYKRTQNGDIFEAGKYYAFYCEESDSHETNEATTWLLNGKPYSTQTIGCDESYIEVCYISEKLEAYVIGDLDGDSELSDWDGVLLARYLAGWNVEIPTLDALDIDGDGEITDWDGVVLDRYLAGWNISIG